VQNVLCARGSPQSQEPMVGVRERPPAADGDEAGVAVFWQDHGATAPECICPYSLLTRAIEYDVLPTCLRHGIGVMTYSPLAGGWLSDSSTIRISAEDADIP
jgi:hypothetical protein